MHRNLLASLYCKPQKAHDSDGSSNSANKGARKCVFGHLIETCATIKHVPHLVNLIPHTSRIELAAAASRSSLSVSCASASNILRRRSSGSARSSLRRTITGHADVIRVAEKKKCTLPILPRCVWRNNSFQGFQRTEEVDKNKPLLTSTKSMLVN